MSRLDHFAVEVIHVSQNEYLTVGAVIEKDDKKYRVIDSNDEYLLLCELETNSINIFYASTKMTLDEVVAGTIVVSFPKPKFVNIEDLPDEHQEEYQYRLSVVRRLRNEYEQDYFRWAGRKKKPVLDEIVAEGKMDRRRIQRLFNRYIQSGFSEYEVIDKRWLGVRKSIKRMLNDPSGEIIEKDEKTKNFDYALEIYKDAGGTCTFRQAYDIMIGSKYSDFQVIDGRLIPVIRADQDVPTFRQFDYYKSKVFTKADKEKVLLGDAQFRNDMRIRVGSSDTGVYGPYDLVEMDAVEFDVSLTGTGRLKDSCVGRPIIYLMKDVTTRMIIAASIGFNNNSIVGCTNCFANLNEDKQALCEKYGVPGFDPTLWLTGYKPRRLRFDNVSDFISGKIEKICEALNIQRDIAPPAGGSYKGVIERSFHSAHQALNLFFEGYGHIKEDYGSKHHQESTIDIIDFIRIFYNYILVFNRSQTTGIIVTDDMNDAGIPQVPSLVMQYYLQRKKPQSLVQGDAFLRCLLIEGKAKLSGDGLTFKQLNYLNVTDQDMLDQMQALKRKRKTFHILYDPRSIDTIYYIKDNELQRAPLNVNYKAQRTYQGKTFAQSEKMFREIKQRSIEEEKKSQQNRIAAALFTESIVASKAKDTYSDVRDMRENREEQKQIQTQTEALDARIGSDNNLIEQGGDNSYDENIVVQDDDIIDVAFNDENEDDIMQAASPIERLQQLSRKSINDD